MWAMVKILSETGLGALIEMQPGSFGYFARQRRAGRVELHVDHADAVQEGLSESYVSRTRRGFIAEAHWFSQTFHSWPAFVVVSL
jgi:hypothetical protein